MLSNHSDKVNTQNAILINTQLEVLALRLAKQNVRFKVGLGKGQIERSQVKVHKAPPYAKWEDIPVEFKSIFDTLVVMVYPNEATIGVILNKSKSRLVPAVTKEWKSLIKKLLPGVKSPAYAKSQFYSVSNGRVGIVLDVKSHNCDVRKLREALVGIEGSGLEIEGFGLLQLVNYDYSKTFPGATVPRLDEAQAESLRLAVKLEDIEFNGVGYSARQNKHYNGLYSHTFVGEKCKNTRGFDRDTVLLYSKDIEELDMCGRLLNLFGSTHNGLHFTTRHKEVHTHSRVRLEVGCSGAKVHSIEELERRAGEAYSAVLAQGLVTSQVRDNTWKEYLPEGHQHLAVVRNTAHGHIEARIVRWFNELTGNHNAAYTEEGKELGSELELQEWLYRNQPRDEQMVVLRIGMEGQVMERVMEPHGGLPDAGDVGLVLGDKTDKSTAKSRKDRLTASDIGMPSFPFSCDSHRTLVDTSDVEEWWKCGSDWVEEQVDVDNPREVKVKRGKLLKKLQANANKALAQYLEDAGGHMQRLNANKSHYPAKFSLVPVVSLVIEAKLVDNAVRLLLPDGKTYYGNAAIKGKGLGDASRKEPMLLVRGNKTDDMPPKMVKGRMVKDPVYGNAELVALNLANFTKYHRAIGLDKSIEYLFWTVDMEDAWRGVETI